MSEHDETPVEDSGMPPRGYVRYDEDVVKYRPKQAPWIIRNGIALLATSIGAVAIAAFAGAILVLLGEP